MQELLNTAKVGDRATFHTPHGLTVSGKIYIVNRVNNYDPNSPVTHVVIGAPRGWKTYVVTAGNLISLRKGKE